MARGKLVFTPSFLSRLAPVFTRYVDLKRALGRRFEVPARTLQNLDRFLYAQDVKYPDLDDAAFQAWCHTHEHVASGVRRVRMLEVRAFCLYRRRSEPRCFIPDINSFPLYHQRIKPYIFRDAEIARLLRAASDMERCPASPLRPETIRLAIVLLYTTGIRRCELLNLRIGDHDRQDSTLHIHETKFYKSRLLPIHSGIADEIDCYLSARGQRRFPAYPESALIWNPSWGGGAYSTTSLRRCIRSLLQECGIVTTKGSPPRIHDFRHSFAVNALLRWYRAGADVEAKLPLLATYMGHGSAVSTHYYLHFIEPLRTASSERFAKYYGALVSPPTPLLRGRR
jgi:integrase/recombinase XerD